MHGGNERRRLLERRLSPVSRAQCFWGFGPGAHAPGFTLSPALQASPSAVCCLLFAIFPIYDLLSCRPRHRLASLPRACFLTHRVSLIINRSTASRRFVFGDFLLDRSLVPRDKPNQMPETTTKIFISYCHAHMSKALKIEEDLAVTDLDLVRDERALGYTEDLESYMKKIRATDYALILVSDAFLRSTNCMFEIHEFLKDDSHQQRVLPVILKDYEDGGVKRKGARIYAAEDAAEYVRYWQDREALLRKHLKGLDISNLTHFARELALIQSVTKTVADFIFLLRKIKHVSFADLVTSEYREILEKVGYGDVGTAQVRKARSLYSQAIAEVNLERRLEFLTKALQTYPSYVDALNKRGQVYDELRQCDKALIDYNRAVNIAPGRAALFISRSYTFIRQADYFNALADLEMALSLDPNHKEAFNNRADVHRRLGKLGEAPSAVAVWGALEVLAQDVFVTLLNLNPASAVKLLTHERTKQLFQLKAIPLDMLSSYDFDVSECLGDILIRYRSVDTIPVMKAVFSVLLPESETLREALEQKDLWILNQRRHLVVHGRGIVDADYISKTGDTPTLGSELFIAPDDLERYLNVTANVGLELITEACTARN